MGYAKSVAARSRPAAHACKAPRIQLKVSADLPDIDDAQCQAVAEVARKHSPVSKASNAVPISREAVLAR